jgi:hypothetical protein
MGATAPKRRCEQQLNDHSEPGIRARAQRWSVDAGERRPDVVVRTSSRALADFVTRPIGKRRLPSREISLSGDADRVAEVIETFGASRRSL